MKQGWEKKKLDDVCLIKGRIGYRGYTKNDLVNKGEGAISLSPSNIKDNRLFFDNCTYISWDKYNESPEIMIYEGDIIFCKTASIGKMALVDYLPEKATLNPQFVVLKNISCSNKYLYYFMICEDFKKQVNNIISGTAVPTLSQKNLGNLKLPLPPLPEQKRIVSILDEAFAAIAKAKANAEQNLKNANELFESYLQGVFEKKGDGWEEMKLGEVLVKTETVDPAKNPDTEFTYLDVSSVNKETKEIETPTVLLGKDAPSRAKKLIRTGDVIFATVRPTHSRVALIPEEFDEQVCSTGYFVLRTKENVNNKLVFYFLLTKGFNEQMEKLQKGASYPAVTDNDVKGILIRFPNSLKEQQTIVRQLDALRAETQKLEAVYQKKIDDLEELKKSILQKAFAGELSHKTIEV